MSTPKQDNRFIWFLLLPIAMLVGVFMLDFKVFKVEGERKGEFSCPPHIKTLKIFNPVGHIEVRVGPPGVVSYHARTLRSAYKEEDWKNLQAADFDLVQTQEQTAGTLSLQVLGLPQGVDPKSTMQQFDVVVKVPVNLALDLHLDKGNVDVNVRQASVRVKTGDGTVVVKNVSADADLESLTDAVLVEDHRGALRAKTTKGMIRATMMDLVADVQLSSEEGEIHCYIPPDCAFRADARTEGGEGQNEFGLTSLVAKEQGWHIQGQVGAGGPLVEIATKRGIVVLRKK